MSGRSFLLAWCLLAASLPAAFPFVPAPKSRDPEWLYRLELPARKHNEKDFTKETRAVTADVFLHRERGQLLYVSNAGTVAVAAGGPTRKRDIQAARWLYRMVLKVRRSGEDDFTRPPVPFGVEVYQDPNAGLLVYVCQAGGIAVAPVGGVDEADLREPKGVYAMDLRARKANEPDFTQDTARYGVVTYHDLNAGHLVYIGEAGTLAVLPREKGIAVKEPTAPKWSHGLILKVRKAGEADFTKGTRQVGMEVFHDRNAGSLLYITETCHLAVLSETRAIDEFPQKEPKWLNRLVFPLAKGATTDARSWGFEMFRNENTGHPVYLAESGAVVVVPAK